MARERLTDIDLAKGVAIFLVVLGHVVAREPPAGNEWYVGLKLAVYQFHMPFFMFLSGAVFHYTSPPLLGPSDYLGYGGRRAARLLPSFLLFSFLVWGAKEIGPGIISGQGDFTIVVEATGQQAGRDMVLDLVEPGGCVVLFGQSPNPWTIPVNIKWRRKDFALAHPFYFPIGMVGEFADIFRARAAEYREMIHPVVLLESAVAPPTRTRRPA